MEGQKIICILLQAWRFVTQIMADAQALIDRLGCMTTHQNKSLRDAAEMALESVLAQVGIQIPHTDSGCPGCMHE